MKQVSQGFTLIELLIVIAIIGILAAVLIPNLLGARKRAYDTAATACARSILSAAEAKRIDNVAGGDFTGFARADVIAFDAKSCVDFANSTSTVTATNSFGATTPASLMNITVGTDTKTFTATVAHKNGSKVVTVTQNGIQ